MADLVSIFNLVAPFFGLILLAGLTVRNEDNPTGDIAIEVTGVREGEKMFEELFYDPSQVQQTRHPKIMRAPKGSKAAVNVPECLERLCAAIATGDEAAVRDVLFSVIAS